MYLKINWKEIWPYEAIMKSDNSVEWDILPILYDNATIELYKNADKRYTLAYKKSTNLFWKELKYADIIDENTWETFSFQVSNIFIAKIVNNDFKILAKVWNELKIYENFWKSEKLIESDWDKSELTPLWYFDMFVSYDDDFYYPLVLNDKNNKTEINRFYDYFWYKAFEDDNWGKHLFMLIEDETSTEINSKWYFVDNFNIISKRLDFDWDDSQYVEEWNINWDWDIYMTITNWSSWYLDKETKEIVKWKISNSSSFDFTRFFEDTDSNFIVWKNTKWLFIIDRTKSEISDKKQESIVYFKDFIKSCVYNDFTFFLMQTFDQEIVLVNENQAIIWYTDLFITDNVKNISFLSDNIYEVELQNWEKRQYVI